jgi:superfamily II DNA or RNA helicase
MKLHAVSPTELRILGVNPGSEAVMLAAHLQYHDKRVDYELQKFKHAGWFIQKYGQEAYDERLAELKASRFKSLLFKDEKGFRTYTGLQRHIQNAFPGTPFESDVEYPTAESLPWALDPLKPYPYQEKALAELLANEHSAVEIGTGLGKTLIIRYLVRKLGLRAVVMAPSTSIAKQIYDTMAHDLGRRVVGRYGDGRHDINKLVTVATAQSLTRIEPGSEAWEYFSAAPVFIADESHLCPATTLQKVCFGMMKASPFRYFFSGTQLRNDGLDLLLDAITGPVVSKMTVKEGIDQGYLARLNVTMLSVESTSGFSGRDPNEMTRAHLFYDQHVCQVVAMTINRLVKLCGYQVLVLVEELEQFARLLPMLRHEAGFAHSGGAGSDVLPLEYQKSDPDKLVERFNDGRLPILVGTSCIATGTDIKANKATVYLRGGKSEIEVMQGAIGRSTRKHELVGKAECQIIDVDVSNIEVLHRHALARRKIYEQVVQVRESDG